MFSRSQRPFSKFLKVEDRAGLVQVFRIEIGDQLIHGLQFLSLGDLNEEQAEEVHQRLRQEAESAIIGDRGWVLALRQL